jgi:hypothetical protein
VGLLRCDGTLVESPPPCGDYPPNVPSAVTSIPFTLNNVPKTSNVSTGAKTRQVQSPSAFVQLSGVGPTDDVTQCDTFYVRVKSGLFQIRVTYNNPAGGTIVSVNPINGLFIQEADAADNFYVTKLEVQGSGTIEYFASGQQ